MFWITALVSVASVGCDEVVEVENLAPVVEPVGWCSGEARTWLVLRLVDREQDSIDLELTFDGCDGGRCAVETGGAGAGLLGLQSASREPGALHRIEWTNAGGAAAGEVALEVQATDAAGLRPAEQLVFPALGACPG